jgi:hypothetical protein
MLELAGDDHNHNASNHGHGSPATGARVAHDDNNDAHERRLLIDGAGCRYGCRRHDPLVPSSR